MKRNTILIADDQEINRAILCQIFENEYNIIEAEDGCQAMDLVEKYEDSLAIVLLDVIMPKADGKKVLVFMRDNLYMNSIPVVLITGSDDSTIEKYGYEMGVSDIVRKPFDGYIVSRRVHNVIDLYNHKNNLESLVKEQTAKLNEQARKLKETNEFVIDTLSTIVEFRDIESGSHIRRIKDFTKILLDEYNAETGNKLSSSTIEKIKNASAMHDIGKIAIPDSILLKPSRLTDEEFEQMKLHTIKGCHIVEKLNNINDKEFYKYCFEICRSHHERWDGRGYPDKLKGDEIPLSAQIVSVADVYDALVSDRCYKKAFTHEQAIKMIVNGECGVFSPILLEILGKVSDKFKALHEG